MKFELIHSEPIYQGRAFSVRKDRVQLPNGGETALDIVEQGQGLAAGAWVCRILVGLGALLLIFGTLGTWVRVQVSLPLLGNVFDRT